MQKLFSMFPQGAPGVALLLLRMSVAATLFIGPGGHLALPAPFWIRAAVGLLAAALCLGFLTPILAALSGLLRLVELIPAGHVDALVVLFAINAAALALLGPGAYSLDAQLFGRRIVVLDTHSKE